MGSTITTTEDQVHARAMSTLATELAAYRAIPLMYDLLPAGTRADAHTAYAVAVLHSEPLTDRVRQMGRAVQIRSRVGVRIQMRVRAGKQTDDYQTALAAGSAVRAALVTQASIETTHGPQAWRWDSSDHRGVADGTGVLIEQIYTVEHRITSV